MLDFFFPKRLHRLSYFLRVLITNGLLYFLESRSAVSDSSAWWPIFLTAVAYQIAFILVPRIRDIGLNVWCWLIVLVPVADVIFGIILLFRAPVMAPRPKPAGTETAAARNTTGEMHPG